MTAQTLDATVVKTDDDNPDVFTQAFDMLSEHHDKPDPVSLSEPDPAVVARPDAAATADQTNLDDPVAVETAAEIKPEVVAPAVKPEAQPSPLGDDFAERLAQALAANQPKPDPAVTPAAPTPQLFSPDEAVFLTEYDKDYPDVARAEALRRRAENKIVVQHVFNEISKVVTPLQELVNSLIADQQLATLQQTVPDYETKREDVVKWVGEQPNYLKAAYNHVIQNGTVEEVADLIGRYNQATGAVKKPAAAQATELPAATKQAAAALAPVGSKRTAVIRGIAKDDFDGAFDEASTQS